MAMPRITSSSRPAGRSGTYALGEARRAEFLARVRRRLAALGWPELTTAFVACLTVGRRR